MSDKVSKKRNMADSGSWQTRAVRAGQQRSPEGEHSDPIYMTSSYVFADAAEAARRFSSEEAGNVYSRYTNPTVRALEERMASMEGAPAAVATASGMSAILSVLMSMLSTGDHVLCARAVFGATIGLLNNYMAKFGLDVDYMDATDLKLWERAIKPTTKMLFIESPSNPTAVVYDIAGLAKLAHRHGLLLVVDNCFCTPALQRPMELGADIVIHSATKYLDGHGRSMGGVVLGDDERMAEVRSFLRNAGPSLSPFNAWLIYVSLETLGIRMQAHSANAMELARRLDEHPRVERVHYAGLSNHPGHALAALQQDAFGGVLAFDLADGDRRSAWQVLDKTRMISLTANLGDAKTTIVHPATTTHWRLSDEDKAKLGISEALIRIAVGLEDVEDIYADIAQALE
jgi:O-succinylhomoserine sulfhydrylase